MIKHFVNQSSSGEESKRMRIPFQTAIPELLRTPSLLGMELRVNCENMLLVFLSEGTTRYAGMKCNLSRG